MTISKEDIIEFLKTLAKDERLQVTVNEAVKGGMIVGGASALGGLLFGPAGLVICACASGCIAALTCKDFKSVVEIIATMDEGKKEALARNVRKIIERVDAVDIANLTMLVSNDSALKQEVAAELVNFVNQEMRSIANH